MILAFAPVRIIPFIPVLHHFMRRNVLRCILSTYYYSQIVITDMFLEADVD